ncbi:MAG: hypothetical protein RIC15_09710 [Vicingaceae bacterium]
MKRLYLLSLVLMTSILTYAQSPLGDEGNQFSLASGYTTAGIPVVASYEMGVYPNISFGIEASYRMFSESTDTATFDHNIAGLSFFGNYYFNEMLNMDEKMGLYAGINFSYYKWFSPDDYLALGKSSSTFAVGAQLGYRYYFGSFGLYIEGVGSTDHVGGKFGLTYRLD